MGGTRFSFTTLVCSILFEGCCRRRRSRHVSSDDTWILLWYALPCGTGPVLCSPSKALIAAPSNVTQLHHHKCCFCSREPLRTTAPGICV